jgi:hypothetical protein
VSEYEFGYEDEGTSNLGEAGSTPQGPKWFREGLDKLSGQVAELRAENAALRAEKTKSEVADALKAKGYAPQAAGLYQGDPTKLDEWLTANGGALARLPEGEQAQGEATPQGPPASTIPADGQADMQRMQEQGVQGVAAPQGSDKELAAAIAAAQSNEELEALMRANGNRLDWR